MGAGAIGLDESGGLATGGGVGMDALLAVEGGGFMIGGVGDDVAGTVVEVVGIVDCPSLECGC